MVLRRLAYLGGGFDPIAASRLELSRSLKLLKDLVEHGRLWYLKAKMGQDGFGDAAMLSVLGES